ncbi:hypothetical protein Q7P37_007946 [Cladosporium fusiforme]
MPSTHVPSEGADQASTLRGTAKVDFAKPLDLSVLKDRVAIVTGGAAGIGLGIVKALAQAGAWVAICDLNEVGRDVEAELAGMGVKFILTDVRSWEAQLAAFKTTLAWTSSRLDIVIPNAGVTSSLSKSHFTNASPSVDPPKPSTLALEVNLTGVYYTALLAVHYFNALSSAREEDTFNPQLCFISSLAGYGDLPFSADYGAAKFGVRGLWRDLRGKRGVNGLGGTQANLIAPTYIRTAMTAGFAEAGEAAGIKFGVVEDVVQGVLRAVADPDVDARAIAILSGQGKPGSMNIDLQDDPMDHDGGKALLEAMQAGKLGPVF